VHAQLKFHKRFEFSQLPKDWTVSRVTVDWKGSALLLIEEGKPPYPRDNTSTDARITWINTPPKAHHLIHWDGSTQRLLTFQKSTGLFTFHVQPFEEGWLLGEARGGRADVYDEAGRIQRTLDLGDASNDVQTTPNGKIWVSYFDEGVYGGGLGSQQGVVCFDSAGHLIFKYFDFAKENNLPFIDDCYAMNVVSEDEVWLSYYSDFPLVSIRSFQLHRAWKDFGCIDRAFSLIEGTVIFLECYTRIKEGNSQLLRRTLSGSSQTEPLEATDDDGGTIGGQFKAAARGPHFYLWTETALYEPASG
jgi:hypothetical protein